MHDNWAAVRRQMEQVLESERALRQVRRQPRPFWQSLWQWRPPALRLIQAQRRSPASTMLSTTPDRGRTCGQGLPVLGDRAVLIQPLADRQGVAATCRQLTLRLSDGVDDKEI